MPKPSDKRRNKGVRKGPKTHKLSGNGGRVAKSARLAGARSICVQLNRVTRLRCDGCEAFRRFHCS